MQVSIKIATIFSKSIGEKRETYFRSKNIASLITSETNKLIRVILTPFFY